MLSLQRIGGLPPLYPGIFAADIDYKGDNYGIFGEAYWQLAPAIKPTLGVRYNEDVKRSQSAAVLPFLSSVDINAGRLLGPDPIWVRGTLASYFGPEGPSAAAVGPGR